VTYLIEYLSEFEFIFETVLGYVSGDQMDSFEAKKRSRKSHAWAPLRLRNLKEFTSTSSNVLMIRNIKLYLTVHKRLTAIAKNLLLLTVDQ
jgi:hypothetical protein